MQNSYHRVNQVANDRRNLKVRLEKYDVLYKLQV